MLTPCRILFLFLAIIAAAGMLAGQKPAAQATGPDNTQKTWTEKTKRWFEMDNLAVSFRFRHLTTNADLLASDVLQYQFQAKGHIKFDPNGKYSVYAFVSTGNSIDSGWGSTGWGTGRAVTNMYLKQLYFQARPIKELEVQFGGIAPNNGENTEVTGYDNDSYLMGERVTIRAPKQLYFDEVVLTNGHFGDFRTPSVFRRFDRLDESNYHQFMIRKKIGKDVSVSADYTLDSGTDTFRQAVKFSIPKFRVFDTMRFENYQRVDPQKDYGFALYGEKVLKKKLTLYTGFSRIDTPMTNGDRFARGNRVYAGWSHKITREFSFNGIWIQGVGPLPGPLVPRTRFEMIFSINVLEMLRRYKLH